MTKILCTVEGCNNPIMCRGVCDKHYYRMRKYGDPLLLSRTAPGERNRYYEDVVRKYEGNDCFIWPYSRRNGYGAILVDGKEGYVHRKLCEDIHGPPPTDRHEAAHSCGNGHLGCCTASHLSWKTPKENQADRVEHGTHNRGEKHNLAKLTEAEVLEIRKLIGSDTQRNIAKKFGVSFHLVSLIHTRKCWSYLAPEQASRLS